mmetsp:Transcript_12278/g.19820  ORF Transcript_12278/g.19820 Transcript_12278/m.19820 type:complete len:490 (-) Transcript_12278:103-1572(-)
MILNTPSFLIALASLPLGVLTLKALWKLRRNSFPTVPCDPSRVVVGNALEFAGENPRDYLVSRHRKYGPLLSVDLISYRAISVGDTELVKQILFAPLKTFVPGYDEVWKYYEDIGVSLIGFGGEQWRTERQAFTPALLRDGPVKTMFPLFVKHIEEALTKWSCGVSNVWAIDQELKLVAIKIILEVAFGKTVEGVNGGTAVLKNVEVIMSEVERRMSSLVHLWRIMPTIYSIPYNRSVRALVQLADNIITARLSGKDPVKDDVLEHMLISYKEGTFPYERLRANVIGVLIGGFDTSSSVMTMAVHSLANHPDVQRKAIEEVDRVLGGATPTYEDLDRLPYLTAVINETIRLYAPAFIVSRKTTGEYKLGDVTLPPNTMVFMAFAYMQTDPNIWGTDSDEFRPERMLGDTNSEQKSLLSQSFLPFSAGMRMCPGRMVAMLEMRTVLAMLLQKFELAPVTGHEKVKMGVRLIYKPIENVYVQLIQRQKVSE